MSLFDYLFDNEYRQRRDIERNETATSALSANVSGVATDLGTLRYQVRELQTLVHVLVTMLAEKGQLDVADVKHRLATELRKPLVGEAKEVNCVRCGQKAMSDKLVKVGTDLWCRHCAANP